MKKIAFCAILLSAGVLSAAEYFVSLQGNDKAAGSKASPFRTIQKGVDKLKEGDILTILPGEYKESVRVILASTGKKPTVIRAAIPGTVVLRGDIEAPSFTLVPGTLFTYCAPWDGPVESVNEIDTFTTYLAAGSSAGLDFERGRWFYDRKEKKLYVVTTNGKSPAAHHLTVSQINKEGMMVGEYNPKRPTRNLHILGLIIRGFFNAGFGIGRQESRRGILGCYWENCSISDCDILFCGGGVRLWRPKKCIIDNVRTRSNGALYDSAGGNIIVNGPCSDTVIRNCSAFNSVKAGIRFYGGPIQRCIIRQCLGGFNGYGDFWIKGEAGDSQLEESAGYGYSYPYSQGNVHNVYYYCGEHKENGTSLQFWRNKLNAEENLGDPVNGDFRPQGDCATDKGLTNRHDLFFLSPSGNDSAQGDSLRAPWKSLAKVPAGATVYLLPGTYSDPMVIAKPGITLAGRGNSTRRPVLAGGVTVAASNVSLKRLSFSKDVTIKNSGVTIRNCGFHNSKVAAANVKLLAVHNCAFDTLPWEFRNVQAKLHSNLYTVTGKADKSSALFSRNNGYLAGTLPAGEAESRRCKVRFKAPEQGDFSVDKPVEVNGFGFLGMPIGTVYRWNFRPADKITGLKVHAAAKGMADVEFFTEQNNMRTWFKCGTDRESVGNMPLVWDQPRTPFRSYSARYLVPGRKYVGRARMENPKLEYFTGGAEKTSEIVYSDWVDFSVPLPAAAPKEYFVSTAGNDANPGTKAKPFRTLSRAAAVAGAGDTVTVRGGVYNDCFYVRASGTKEKPVTFRAAPGEKVWWEGFNQHIAFGAMLMNKQFVRFQDFYFRNFMDNSTGAVTVYGGNNIELSHIFYDGRSPNYTPSLIRAFSTGKLHIHDCFIARGFTGIVLADCPDFLVEHNLFHVNQLTALDIHPGRYGKGVVRNNIFFDNILQKQVGPTVACSKPRTLQIENNLFYWRLPASQRLLTGLLLGRGKRYTLPEYRAMIGGKETNILANPKLKASPELFTFKNQAERDRRYRDLEKLENAKEQGRISPTEFKPWDWSDVLPAPEFRKYGPRRK